MKFTLVMESAGSKGELIKPILLMIGIPLAFSVAGFLIARITDGKISSLNDRIQENSSETESPKRCRDEEDNYDNIENTHERNTLEEQIRGLRSKIQELQEKECEIEIRFFRYCDLKEQEHALMESQNSLILEKERAEFLEKELSSMELENKKFDEMVIDYLKAMEELESSRSENGLLRTKVKKLLKKMRESSRLVRKQNLRIEAREVKILNTKVELERKENMIKGLENEVEKMQAAITRLLVEKNKLLNKLEMAENSSSLKAEAEEKLTENYNKLVNELEQIQKDRAVEMRELIYLRWCHACLKHELMRRNQLEQEGKKTEELGQDFGTNEGIEGSIEHESSNIIVRDEPFFGGDQRHSKRRWLVKKFKKWVDGNEKGKQNDHKCFGSHSIVDEVEERHSPRRNSYCSA